MQPMYQACATSLSALVMTIMNAHDKIGIVSVMTLPRMVDGDMTVVGQTEAIL